MPRLPDPLPERIEAALSDASSEELSRIDQLAALCRDWWEDRGLDLRDSDISQASLTSLTVAYALLQSARARGELDQAAWDVVNDVVSSTAAAVVVTRAASAQPAA